MIFWMRQLGGETVAYGSSVGEKYSFWCAAFAGLLHMKKEPITVSQLEQSVACKTDAMASLYNIRSVVICLVAFAEFL